MVRVPSSDSRSFMSCTHTRPSPVESVTGNAKSLGLSDARTLARRIAFSVAEGGGPLRSARLNGARALLGNSRTFVNEHSRLKNKSWKQARDLVQRNAIPRLGNLPANAVTREDVKKMFASIKSPTTANRTPTTVSAIFTFAIKETPSRLIPARHSTRTHIRARPRPIGEQLREVWPILRDQYPALALVLVTGQRIWRGLSPAPRARRRWLVEFAWRTGSFDKFAGN